MKLSIKTTCLQEDYVCAIACSITLTATNQSTPIVQGFGVSGCFEGLNKEDIAKKVMRSFSPSLFDNKGISTACIAEILNCCTFLLTMCANCYLEALDQKETAFVMENEFTRYISDDLCLGCG